MAEYRCAACGLAVIVLPVPATPIKACACDAAIVGCMSASAVGGAAMKG